MHVQTHKITEVTYLGWLHHHDLGGREARIPNHKQQ